MITIQNKLSTRPLQGRCHVKVGVTQQKLIQNTNHNEYDIEIIGILFCNFIKLYLDSSQNKWKLKNLHKQYAPGFSWDKVGIKRMLKVSKLQVIYKLLECIKPSNRRAVLQWK